MICLDNARSGRVAASGVGRILSILLACGAVACGDDEATPTAPANQPPTIIISSSASFGIAQLTTFVFTATAADPDGNPISVTWSVGDDASGAGTTLWKTFSTAGTVDVVASARDHTGATTMSNVVTVTVGSATGTWSGTIDLAACEAGTKPVTATLSQAGSAITGTVSLPEGLCSPSSGTASIGPEEPGRMFGSGAMRIRVVVTPTVDVSFEGQMDITGQQVTGTLQGSEPSGMPFTLTKQ